MSRLPLLALAVVVATALASCGGDGDDGNGGTVSETTLEGRAFVSSGISGRELAPGSEINLTFEDGRMGFNADCNSISAPYTSEDGELRFDGDTVGTLIGCPPELQDQDEWLTSWFEAGVAASHPAEGSLTLEGEGVSITFTEQPA